jgi:hypothetical protein
MDQYKPGDFGTFTFVLRSKKEVSAPHLIEGAEITETDRWYVYLQDMEGNTYMPRKDDIIDFKPQTKQHI